MSKLQPGEDESNIEVHSQWLQQEVPWFDSFSSLGYPSQLPSKSK